MVSPLKDNKGGVRYFIGARIDVTQLVDGGKTMDSFHQLLTGNRPVTPVADPLENRPTLRALRDFGDLLNEEEKGSMRDIEMMRIDSRPSTPTARVPNSPLQRRFLGIEERISQDGLRAQYAGQIPGVYQNVRISFPPTAQLTNPVHPRAPLSLPAHHLHLTLPPHPRTLPIQTRGPYRRPRARTRLTNRSARARNWRHRKSLLANPRQPTIHQPLHPAPLGRRKHRQHLRHHRGQSTLDPLHTTHRLRRQSRRHHDHHGRQARHPEKSARHEQSAQHALRRHNRSRAAQPRKEPREFSLRGHDA
jgi:hypothetical protein